MPKTYADTYIYRQYPEYEKKLFEFIHKAERVNTKSKEFEDVLYDIKRRKISDSLAKIITSDNVVLGILEGDPLPKAFKAFPAKDLKEEKTKIKVFIDVTSVVELKDGVYICRNLDWLMSYVVNAMTAFIYTIAPNKILGNASVLKDGGEAFMKCFSYILDRQYKISTVQQLKKRVEYLSLIYYQVSLMDKDFDKSYDSIVANAIKISDIDKRDSGVIDAMFNKEDFGNIDVFTTALGRLGFKDIKISNMISTWMQSFGTGTVFGLEYFPGFSAMLTNTYIGGYIDQQITIEKITSNSMVSFTKTILQIGASVS